MDRRPSDRHESAVAVFRVLEVIPEIGADPGDRIVVRPGDAERPALLQRTIDPRWAFVPQAELAFTKPTTVPQGMILRAVREALTAREVGRGPLTLLD